MGRAIFKGVYCSDWKRVDDHIDGDKSNNSYWNLASLCQRCHLHIQSKVYISQFYMFEHTEWFKSHVSGYYRSIGQISTS